jgi:hypothetical protein
MLTEVRGFLQSLQTNAGIVPRLGHNRFLPNPFQFIIHDSSYYPPLYSLDTERVVNTKKITTKKNEISEQCRTHG